MDLVNALVKILAAVIDAVAKGDAKRVNEILPRTLRTTLIKRAKDLAAEQKYTGPG